MSILKDKYINPLIELPKFTKKEDELVTDFDKWLYVFRYLSKLQDRPLKLQNKIFKRLFEAAEIAKFSPEEREAYEDSLKFYRDINNVVDTSKEEGKAEGRTEDRAEGSENRNIEIAKETKKNGEPIAAIMKYTNLKKTN